MTAPDHTPPGAFDEHDAEDVETPVDDPNVADARRADPRWQAVARMAFDDCTYDPDCPTTRPHHHDPDGNYVWHDRAADAAQRFPIGPPQ